MRCALQFCSTSMSYGTSVDTSKHPLLWLALRNYFVQLLETAFPRITPVGPLLCLLVWKIEYEGIGNL